MKRLLVMLALLATPAAAKDPATLTCAFQSGESFTAVGQNGTSMIQWDNGKFYDAVANYDEPWLTIIQTSETGNVFKMAFNVRTKEAYGETTFKDGKKKGGPLWCVFK